MQACPVPNLIDIQRRFEDRRTIAPRDFSTVTKCIAKSDLKRPNSAGRLLHCVSSSPLSDDMISDDAYRTSTQYRLFSFPSRDSLLSQRTKTNAHSRSLVPSQTPYLTVQEEVELVDYYIDKLWGIVNIFKLSSHVKVATPLSPSACFK